MLFLALLTLTLASPVLEKVLDRTGWELEELANRLHKSELAAVVQPFEEPAHELSSNGTVGDGVPLVFMHGMGDSCFNSGMKQITELSGKHLDVYSVCIPTGKNRASDTTNGFFMTMDDNVDVWAEKVMADPKLANGFHAVGFSQGNSVIRGYIHKYNNPPVKTFLSVHGTVMGVAGFPNCDPNGLLGPVCKLLAEFLGDLAYEKFVQNMLFQADYFRDPHRLNDTKYLTNSEIAQWNQENTNTANFTFKQNFVSVKKFAMIKALKDTMIFPNEGEWWGQFAPGSMKTVQTMKETALYQSDAFGLKTVDEAGKIVFNTTDGNHLQFSQSQLFWWLDHYLEA